MSDQESNDWKPLDQVAGTRGGDPRGATTGDAKPKSRAMGFSEAPHPSTGEQTDTLPNGDRADARAGPSVDEHAPATEANREHYVSANGPPGSERHEASQREVHRKLEQ